MSFGFGLTDLVFLEGVYIRIEIEDDGCDIMRQEPLHDGAGAGCTAGMQQYFVASFRHYDSGLFGHIAHKNRHKISKNFLKFQNFRLNSYKFFDICKKKCNFVPKLIVITYDTHSRRGSSLPVMR